MGIVKGKEEELLAGELLALSPSELQIWAAWLCILEGRSLHILPVPFQEGEWLLEAITMHFIGKERPSHHLLQVQNVNGEQNVSQQNGFSVTQLGQIPGY